jgi:hypothetical protein
VYKHDFKQDGIRTGSSGIFKRIKRFGDAVKSGQRPCFDKNAGQEMVQPKHSQLLPSFLPSPQTSTQYLKTDM